MSFKLIKLNFLLFADSLQSDKCDSIAYRKDNSTTTTASTSESFYADAYSSTCRFSTETYFNECYRSRENLDFLRSTTSLPDVRNQDTAILDRKLLKLAVTKILHFNLLNNDDEQNYDYSLTVISITEDKETEVRGHRGEGEGNEFDPTTGSPIIIKDDEKRNDNDKTLDTEEDDMAVHLRNKIAQAFGVGSSTANDDTLNRNGTIASSVGGGIGGASGDMGLFNISRAKKVELQTLSSRISDAGLTGKYFMQIFVSITNN